MTDKPQTDVASLKLCKELFELSGWDGDEPDRLWWGLVAGGYQAVPCDSGDFGYSAPAYTLGYLLRKLPDYVEGIDAKARPTLQHWNGRWAIGFSDGSGLTTTNIPHCEEETPEDATAKLAIELIKQKVIIP